MTLDALTAMVDDVRRQAVNLDVRSGYRVTATDERTGLRDDRGHRARPEGQILDHMQGGTVPAVLFVVADGCGLGREVYVHVILKILADPGQVVDDVNTECT